MPVTQICPYLRIQYKYIGYNRPHPLYCPQFLQCQHKIGQISCPVEGGARILEVRNLEVRLYCQHTSQLLHPCMGSMHVPSCNNAGVYLTSYTDARTSVTYSCYIIGYPWPTYIRWRVIYCLPLTQSLKNCISIAGLIQYAALNCTGS